MGVFDFLKDINNRDVSEYIRYVESYFIDIGLDIGEPQMSGDGVGWEFSYGSIVIKLSLEPIDETLFLMIHSPLVHMPETNLLPFYRKCLETNLELFYGSLAMSGDILQLRYVRPLFGLQEEEFSQIMNQFAAIADLLDDSFVEEFKVKRFSN